MRPLNSFLQDNDHFEYPHDDEIEEIIKKTDKICDKYTCDECPLSLGIMLSPNVSDDPTECIGVLLENQYRRYQIEHEKKV